MEIAETDVKVINNVLVIGSLVRPAEPPETNGDSMSLVLKRLKSTKMITGITVIRKVTYEYDFDTTRLLTNFAAALDSIERDDAFASMKTLKDTDVESMLILKSVINYMYEDPIGGFVEIRRLLRKERVKDAKSRFVRILEQVVDIIYKTDMIQAVEDRLDGHKVGNRGLYAEIMNHKIRPSFVLTSISQKQPPGAKELDSYEVGGNRISIYRSPGAVRNIYFIIPPETGLSEKEMMVIDLIRRTLERYKPLKESMIDPMKVRSMLFSISKDLVNEYASRLRINMDEKKANIIAEMITRETAGFGMIENLVEDPKVQDVLINPPPGSTPIYIYHEEFEECETNVYPSVEEAVAWSSKLRMLSGRPLDQGSPVLDTSVQLPVALLRLAGVTNPLSPYGMGFALRRHRERPWTYPLFIKNRMFNPLAAGLMSFLIDSSRTFLIAGTRSSGKTAFLGSCMVEIMRKYRVVTVEDTLELPLDYLRNLGYNLQPLKVRSPIRSIETELSATEGIRTALRLGDSVLIIGEVRSKEAIALYEAMRVGALANVVAGTIHGDSPYGVYDRIVNDLGVTNTSFKATDVIVICNPIKSQDGLHRWRRMVSITEVGKKWKQDPMEENAFMDMMVYNTKKDELVPTEHLLNGNSEIIKNVIKTVRGWKKWEDIWENIQLRGKVKEMLLRYADSLGIPEMLESEFVVKANDKFHLLIEEVTQELGSPVPKEILTKYESWLKSESKKLK